MRAALQVGGPSKASGLWVRLGCRDVRVQAACGRGVARGASGQGTKAAQQPSRGVVERMQQGAVRSQARRDGSRTRNAPLSGAHVQQCPPPLVSRRQQQQQRQPQRQQEVTATHPTCLARAPHRRPKTPPAGRVSPHQAGGCAPQQRPAAPGGRRRDLSRAREPRDRDGKGRLAGWAQLACYAALDSRRQAGDMTCLTLFEAALSMLAWLVVCRRTRMPSSRLRCCSGWCRGGVEQSRCESKEVKPGKKERCSQLVQLAALQNTAAGSWRHVACLLAKPLQHLGRAGKVVYTYQHPAPRRERGGSSRVGERGGGGGGGGGAAGGQGGDGRTPLREERREGLEEAERHGGREGREKGGASRGRRRHGDTPAPLHLLLACLTSTLGSELVHRCRVRARAGMDTR